MYQFTQGHKKQMRGHRVDLVSDVFTALFKFPLFKDLTLEVRPVHETKQL